MNQSKNKRLLRDPNPQNLVSSCIAAQSAAAAAAVITADAY